MLKPNDIFLLDRGIRDCIQKLENEYGFIAKMPALIQKNQSQLTTEEANSSRLVTKCRWVVEVTNAFLKSSFKALRDVNNKSLDHTIVDYRIAAALINKYFNRLHSDIDKSSVIVRLMKEKLAISTNEVQEFVKEHQLHKASQFNKIDDAETISDFPHLSIDDLKMLTLGSYQLFQSKGYIAEHISKNQ